MSKLIDKLTQFRTVHNECKHNYVLRRTHMYLYDNNVHTHLIGRVGMYRPPHCY